MGTSLVITLPWGRYHATPWGRNVNEAAVEWPPSPWRLLRALYATWQGRLPDLTSEVVTPVLEALCAAPRYWLPQASFAHSRHFMPLAEHQPGVTHKTSKAFDPFAVVERDAMLLVEWLDIDLDDAQRDVLARIAAAVPYLGRAESLCRIRLAPRKTPVEELVTRSHQLCSPLTDDVTLGLETETVRVLVPERPLDVKALTIRTSDVQRQRLPAPQGTRWVSYPAVSEPERQPQSRPRRRPRPDAVRWAIVTKAKPSVHAAVAYGHVLRGAAMAQHDDAAAGGPSPTLSGKDADGRRREGHRHAHYLALDEDGDGLLDTLVLWAPEGLGGQELIAATRIRDLRSSEHVKDFRNCELGLEAVGSVVHVAPMLTGPAQVWTSHTPFSPPRHAKRHQDWHGHIEKQVREELERRGLDRPDEVELLTGRPWLAFRRHRPSKEKVRHARRAVGVHLIFASEVEGPIAIGALSHFGLGLFVPDTSQPAR